MARGLLIAFVALGFVAAAGCSGQLDYEPEAYVRAAESERDAAAPVLQPPPSPPDAAPSLPEPQQQPQPRPEPEPVPAPVPEPTPTPDAAAADSAPTAAGCPNGVDALSIMVQHCGNCHGAVSGTKGLDLVSPGVATRLVAVKSTCFNRDFLELGDGPAQGYFVDKLLGPVEGCGSIMPFAATPLSAEELSCLMEWAGQAVARGLVPGGN